MSTETGSPGYIEADGPPAEPGERGELASVVGMDGQPYAEDQDDGGQRGRVVIAAAGLVVAVGLLAAAWWMRRQARAQHSVAVSAGPAPEWAYDGGPAETVEPGRPPQGEGAADATGEAASGDDS